MSPPLPQPPRPPAPGGRGAVRALIAASLLPLAAPSVASADEVTVSKIVKDAGPLRAQATSALDAALAHRDLGVRGEALAALGASGRADAYKILAKKLQETEGELRFAAARGLGLLGDPRASEQLLVAWRDEKGWSVKKEIARAAGRCAAIDLIPELKLAINDPTVHPEVRDTAAFALQDLGDPDAEKLLAKLGNPQRKVSAKPGTDKWSRKVLGGQKEGDALLATRTLVELGGADDVALFAGKLSAADPALRAWAAAGVLKFSK